ncbi:hypothetical protein K402DRAFT_388524 [Aulographum hederae CBS 113979]|uniref:Uncharacterized protein n=1 Tax=Aulographum hederae CBS 113979 TaxID=1176131 RepID=A0A6G1HFX4_9PEZI|nr:hypothetical protein K402DRAFT_388524 [Aulographum hederae CBS 113979]
MVDRALPPSLILLLLAALAAVSVRASPSDGSLNVVRETTTDPVVTPPPFSRHATHDLSLLPAQVCGIVGAYFLCVVVVGTCLLTFGKRMRREAQYGPSPSGIEMVKTPTRTFDPSPLSPASTTRTWMKNKFGGSKKSLNGSLKSPSLKSQSSSTPNSPGYHQGTPSFDAKVLENDKEERQREMERLYAAVMEHDAKQAKVKSVASQEEIQPADPANKPGIRIATEELKHPGPYLISPTSPASPTSPRSPIRGIYPPDSPLPDGPPTSSSPVRAGERQTFNYPSSSQPQRSPGMPQGMPPSPRGILVNRQSRTSSVGSGSSSKTRRALRNLRISAPRALDGVDDDERTPLTPRFYDPPPPPPLPPQSGSQPPTPHTGRTTTSQMTVSTVSSGGENDYLNEYGYERLDKPQPLPRPAPQRSNTGKSVTLELPEQKPSYAAHAMQKSANNSSGSLPLRNMTSSSPVHASSSTTFPSSSNNDSSNPQGYQQPPTPIKTTYLERRPQNSANRGPNTAGLTPRTGVPMTPYSPYMPFTPITPVTPHLVTKKEMKDRKKGFGKRGVADTELVRNEGELWDSGY